MTAQVDGDGTEQWPDVAEALLVLALMAVPIPVVVVLVGPSSEVLFSLAGYGLFVVGSLVLTWLVWDRSGADEHAE